MLIVLPYPAPNLSPNARVHWAKKAKSAKLARWAALNATMSAINGGMREARNRYAGEEPIPMMVVIIPPDNRRRDFDNAIASLKSSLDGIADALAVNDHRFVPTFRVEKPEKPGRIEVTL